MNMRGRFRLAIASDAAIIAILSQGGLQTAQVVSQGAKDETVKQRPHIIIRWGVRNPGVGGLDIQNITVWVHDEPADYTNINDVLRRIRNVIIPAIVGIRCDDGVLSQARWNGDSENLTDADQRTIVRNGSYELITTGG